MPIPKVSDIRFIRQKGPWITKSGGALSVLFAIPGDDAARFFTESPISGFRIYQISNPKIEKTGGMEWHIYRQEIFLVAKGHIEWFFEDAWGNTAEFFQDGGTAIWVPNYIVHSYRATDECLLVVVANTIYDPLNPDTHDTYAREKLFELIPK